jgi:hypothetical protein
MPGLAAGRIRPRHRSKKCLFLWHWPHRPGVDPPSLGAMELMPAEENAMSWNKVIVGTIDCLAFVSGAAIAAGFLLVLLAPMLLAI